MKNTTPPSQVVTNNRKSPAPIARAAGAAPITETRARPALRGVRATRGDSRFTRAG